MGFPSYVLLTSKKIFVLLGDLQHPSCNLLCVTLLVLRGRGNEPENSLQETTSWMVFLGVIPFLICLWHQPVMEVGGAGSDKGLAATRPPRPCFCRPARRSMPATRCSECLGRVRWGVTSHGAVPQGLSLFLSLGFPEEERDQVRTSSFLLVPSHLVSLFHFSREGQKDLPWHSYRR